jgi:hypothetical protein
MINFLKKLLAKMNKWIYGPPCTCTRCDADDDEEQKSKKGGVAY